MGGTLAVLFLAALPQIDLFWGNGVVDLPPSEGAARGWNWEKAQSGNTHPGAVLPFGWVSACAYSGGYPTGYGTTCCSWGGPCETACPQPVGFGISHFHHSGTGWIHKFYNYLLVTPSVEGANTGKPSRLIDETAVPGFYAAKLADYGAAFELVPRRYAACHRYRFSAPRGFLAIDAANVGLRREFVRTQDPSYMGEKVESVAVRKTGAGSWAGTIRAHGVDLHFAYQVRGKTARDFCRDGGFGCAIAGDAADAFVGFSLVDVAEAQARAAEAAHVGFDRARQEAVQIWTEKLSRVSAAFADPAAAKVFDSALYHAFVKPVDCGTGYVDFSTFWDIYKTELPLVFTLDRASARGMLEHVRSVVEKRGFAPICQIMDSRIVHKDVQATAIPVYSLCDGYWRGVLTQRDWPWLKDVFAREFAHADVKGMSPTHVLDLTGAYGAAGAVARACGDAAYADALQAKTDLWQTVYDPKTGLLVKDAVYYEGNHWNYSFRPHPGMNARVALAGGTARFAALLDRFFAFDAVPADWDPAADRLRRPDHFEGLNNESDMESPYAYLWCGRVDRLAEVVDLVRRCRFAPGKGGCPGNNDSGATGSWYVWNALGLFPLSGTPWYLLGSPAVESARIRFPDGTLAIDVRRESPRSIYPHGYELNGRAFREPWLKVRDVEKGGKLTFRLGDRPAPSSPIPDWL